jgi:hypothetical protein
VQRVGSINQRIDRRNANKHSVCLYAPDSVRQVDQAKGIGVPNGFAAKRCPVRDGFGPARQFGKDSIGLNDFASGLNLNW